MAAEQPTTQSKQAGIGIPDGYINCGPILIGLCIMLVLPVLRCEVSWTGHDNTPNFIRIGEPVDDDEAVDNEGPGR